MLSSCFKPAVACHSCPRNNAPLLSLRCYYFLFVNFPLYLQSVPANSANVVKSCTEACRRVLTSTLLYVIGPEASCDLRTETYKRNLINYIYNYSIYILNLVGRSIGKFFRNRLVSGGSCRFRVRSFGCTLRRLL
jgi:hypothetical protein